LEKEVDMTEEEFRLKLIKQQQNQRYYKRHRTQILAYNSAYYNEHREEYIAYQKAYRELNRNGRKNIELPKISQRTVSAIT
jgi:hypothetical protein